MIDQTAVAKVKSSGAFRLYGFGGDTFTTASGEIVTLDQALAILDQLEQKSADDK